MHTEDKGGSEGASDGRTGGDAASRGDGGALQKHVVDRLRRAMGSSFEDDSGWAERGVVEGFVRNGLIWVEVGIRTHPGKRIGQSEPYYYRPRDLTQSSGS